MIEQLTTDSDRILGFQIRGRLHEEGSPGSLYRSLKLPLKHKARFVFCAEFHDFHGWDLHALWDDVKFAIRHCRDIERVALVGEKKNGTGGWPRSVCRSQWPKSNTSTLQRLSRRGCGYIWVCDHSPSASVQYWFCWQRRRCSILSQGLGNVQDWSGRVSSFQFRISAVRGLC